MVLKCEVSLEVVVRHHQRDEVVQGDHGPDLVAAAPHPLGPDLLEPKGLEGRWDVVDRRDGLPREAAAEAPAEQALRREAVRARWGAGQLRIEPDRAEHLWRDRAKRRGSPRRRADPAPARRCPRPGSRARPARRPPSGRLISVAGRSPTGWRRSSSSRTAASSSSTRAEALLERAQLAPRRRRSTRPRRSRAARVSCRRLRQRVAHQDRVGEAEDPAEPAVGGLDRGPERVEGSSGRLVGSMSFRRRAG